MGLLSFDLLWAFLTLANIMLDLLDLFLTWAPTPGAFSRWELQWRLSLVMSTGEYTQVTPPTPLPLLEDQIAWLLVVVFVIAEGRLKQKILLHSPSMQPVSHSFGNIVHRKKLFTLICISDPSKALALRNTEIKSTLIKRDNTLANNMAACKVVVSTPERTRLG